MIKKSEIKEKEKIKDKSLKVCKARIFIHNIYIYLLKKNIVDIYDY